MVNMPREPARTSGAEGEARWAWGRMPFGCEYSMEYEFPFLVSRSFPSIKITLVGPLGDFSILHR